MAGNGAYKPKILIVDDEATIRFAIHEFLDTRGFDLMEADCCEAARAAMPHFHPDAVIMDYSLPDGNALELLAEFKAAESLAPTIILTAHGSIDLAVRAIKEGAEHFLTKPVELSALALLLDRVLETQQGRRAKLKVRSSRNALDPFVGDSAAIRELAEKCSEVAASDVPVVLWGETGCGKGVLAKWMHENSLRKEGLFVDINCAGISQELLESELFGHEKGAFTGAMAVKNGLLEVAHGGTLFLDEIGDMQPLVQAKLLKALEEKQFRRLGAVRNRSVNFRAIAATHHNLAAQVREGKFRADLFFRISAIDIRVPSLRERPEDIPILAQQLLGAIGADLARSPRELSQDALAALQAYPWTGNIRELRNVLERAALLTRREVLTPADLRLQQQAAGLGQQEDAFSLEEIERAHIEKVLKLTKGQMSRAAQLLGISKSTLYAKVKGNPAVVQKASS